LIPQSYVDDVLARASISDVIGGRVTLKKTGKNWSSLCPFHDEKSPSFTVNDDKQLYYCFGCGASGNVIGFIMAYEGVEFPQAVRSLGVSLGLGDPEKGERPVNAMPTKTEKGLRNILVTEQLIVAMSESDIGKGIALSPEDSKRYELAKERIKKIHFKLAQAGI
jgi:DNA primase